MEQINVTVGQRQGFQRALFSIQHYNKLAELARKLRLSNGFGGKPRLSALLKQCTMSQTMETYADESGVCALGAIARMLNVKLPNGVDLDWNALVDRSDVTRDELCRQVKCPVVTCTRNYKDGIVSTIAHLNDDHKMNFKEIGTFLERYDL